MKTTPADKVRPTGENRIAQDICNAIINASWHLAKWIKEWRDKK